ncbi:GntP family permease [Dysosmobacter sp. Marseille-Q4140]|jgi:H+/gluconate symporter-like permease|nr:GntP family permease [Dysosmobacter sp. Marseille-Q4140]
MIVLSVVGILLAFGVLVFAAYKKISMFLAAVIAASLVALFSGLPVAASMVGAEGPFLIGMKDFVGSWLVIFAMGALLGALYDKSGATWRISSTLINKAGTQWTLLIYVLVGGLLVYGGIQVTVMIFVLLPFAKILFPKAGIPWYLFPGITGLAIATFAMGQMPGSLQMQNIIPSQILGTSLTAAPVEGVLATLFMVVFGVGYLSWEAKKGRDTPEAAIELYQVQGGTLDEAELEGRAPGFWVSLIPMVVAFVLINGVKVELLYGLGAGCVLSVLMFWKSLGGLTGIRDVVSEGFNNGIFPCIIIASVVGVGKVISATDVFALIQGNIINLPLPGLLKVAAITTIIAGITGSASGGLTIALELFGETFMSWGYTPEIIHRVASIACGGLDTLPWNGTVVMLFALSGVSYKKGYKHVAVETVILPLLSLIPVFLYYSITH